MAEPIPANRPWFWWGAATLLRRSRRLLGLGGLAALVVGGAVLGGFAVGVPWSAAERAALLALPASWAGVFAAAVLAGSPGVRHHGTWAAVVLACSAAVIGSAGLVLRTAG